MAKNLTLYDTYLKSDFMVTPETTTESGKLKIYSCGPTVYSYQTIGNSRAVWFGEVIELVGKLNGLEVKRVVNVTDVGHLVGDGDDGEDKIEKGAKRDQKSVQEIVDFYLEDFKKQCKALHINLPSGKFFPKATDYILEQMLLALTLLLEKKAYILTSGIYFDHQASANEIESVLKLPGMPKGNGDSHFTDREIKNTTKNSQDFALWKFVSSESLQKWRFDDFKETQKLVKQIQTVNNNSNKEVIYLIEKLGQMWGCPGWHSECVTMISQILGGQNFSQFSKLANLKNNQKSKHTFEIDIHTGGEDHIPIHHKNEILQSQTLGFCLSKNWVHNKFVLVDEQKMSKSLGNVYLVTGQFKTTGFYSLTNPPTEEFSPELKTQILKKYKELKLADQQNNINNQDFWEQFAFDPLAYRLLLLEHNYRQPLNFTWEKLWQSQQRLWNLRKESAKLLCLLKIDLNKVFTEVDFSKNSKIQLNEEYFFSIYKKVSQTWLEIINNDLDFPKFLSEFQNFINQINQSQKSSTKISQIVKLIAFWELNLLKLNLFPNIGKEIIDLGNQRKQAKLEKNYILADKLKTQIQNLNFQIDDYADGNFGIWKLGIKKLK